MKIQQDLGWRVPASFLPHFAPIVADVGLMQAMQICLLVNLLAFIVCSGEIFGLTRLVTMTKRVMKN
ncbi:hypothetical protein [Nitrosomonas sp. Nm33]|uniref:hypothetical protein n=1 Tax=Nitrosomonas sp. Nm33 TaxID=133724 RepID=UPI00089B5687|nr:hypothetical protein [Nitrosomonas sp. Nm33]SDY30840.1 hypothetical protein SAMN05421755_101543 [Nitrosomonas sp. Nm33]